MTTATEHEIETVYEESTEPTTGITAKQMSILKFLMNNPEAMCSQISKETGISRPYLSRVLISNHTSLYNRGLVEIYEYEPDDFCGSPYFTISVTREGAKLVMNHKPKKKKED